MSHHDVLIMAEDFLQCKYVIRVKPVCDSQSTDTFPFPSGCAAMRSAADLTVDSSDKSAPLRRLGDLQVRRESRFSSCQQLLLLRSKWKKHSLHPQDYATCSVAVEMEGKGVVTGD